VHADATFDQEAAVGRLALPTDPAGRVAAPQGQTWYATDQADIALSAPDVAAFAASYSAAADAVDFASNTAAAKAVIYRYVEPPVALDKSSPHPLMAGHSEAKLQKANGPAARVKEIIGIVAKDDVRDFIDVAAHAIEVGHTFPQAPQPARLSLIDTLVNYRFELQARNTTAHHNHTAPTAQDVTSIRAAQKGNSTVTQRLQARSALIATRARRAAAER